MSLINDALNRAKESRRNETPSGMSPLRPVETNQPEREFNLLLPVAITFLAVTAFALIGLAMVKHADKKIPAEKIAAAPVIAPKPEVAVAALLVTNVAPPAAPVTNPPTPAVATINPIVTAAPAPRPLRLQGIAYDAAHPSAIIGGKAVFVGGLVDGMRVMAISPESVTLAGEGRTKTLIVGPP